VESRAQVTQLLQQLHSGDRLVEEQLTALIWQELHCLAERHMRSENPNHTLQATALVNEAYIKLVNMDVDWQNRSHFFALAANQMRRILVDHARLKAAQKRGNPNNRVTFDEGQFANTYHFDDLIYIDQLLTQLHTLDSRAAEILELRLFSGLTLEDIAQLKQLSLSTVERELRTARAWLQNQISKYHGCK